MLPGHFCCCLNKQKKRKNQPSVDTMKKEDEVQVEIHVHAQPKLQKENTAQELPATSESQKTNQSNQPEKQNSNVNIVPVEQKNMENETKTKETEIRPLECYCKLIPSFDTHVTSVYLDNFKISTKSKHIHAGILFTVWNTYNVIIKSNLNKTEIINLEKLDHVFKDDLNPPHIPMFSWYTLEGKDPLIYMLILKKGPPDLFSFLQNAKRILRLPEVLCILNILISKVIQLHDKNFAHLDISLENVLYDPKSKEMKLIDWEFSKFLNPEDEFHFNTEESNTRVKGKVNYMSEEHYEMKPINGFQSDIFAIGVLAFELVIGNQPFEKQRTKQASLFHSGSYNQLLSYFTSNQKRAFFENPQVADFISTCCCGSSKIRPRHASVLSQHPLLLAYRNGLI